MASSDAGGMLNREAAMIHDAIERLGQPYMPGPNQSHLGARGSQIPQQFDGHPHELELPFIDSHRHGQHTVLPQRVPTVDEIRAMVSDTHAYDACAHKSTPAVHVVAMMAAPHAPTTIQTSPHTNLHSIGFPAPHHRFSAHPDPVTSPELVGTHWASDNHPDNPNAHAAATPTATASPFSPTPASQLPMLLARGRDVPAPTSTMLTTFSTMAVPTSALSLPLPSPAIAQGPAMTVPPGVHPPLTPPVTVPQDVQPPAPPDVSCTLLTCSTQCAHVLPIPGASAIPTGISLTMHPAPTPTLALEDPAPVPALALADLVPECAPVWHPIRQAAMPTP